MRMGGFYGHRPYTGGEIKSPPPLVVYEQTEVGMLQFIWVVTTYTPDTAALMVPMGLAMDQDIWQAVHWVGGASYGGVMSGLRQVGIIQNGRLKFPTKGESNDHVI